MNKIITFAIIALMVIEAHAQESAKYRITYDCDALQNRKKQLPKLMLRIAKLQEKRYMGT